MDHYEFESDGWFEMYRGTVATFMRGTLPDEVEHPSELMNLVVRIDGDLYLVKGVETQGYNREPFGLLVERVV